MKTHQPESNRSLRVVIYTDSAGIGGAEINLGHLVASVSSKIDITILGTTSAVVEAIAQTCAFNMDKLSSFLPAVYILTIKR